MNTSTVDKLLESLFFREAAEGGLEDQPHPRFKWTPPAEKKPVPAGHGPYQPKTGARCHCKPGVQRDNCPDCEGTGMRIDFKAIRERPLSAKPAGEPLPDTPAKPAIDVPGEGEKLLSMKELMPKSEVATMDDLLDFFNRIKAEKNRKRKAAMQREFELHRGEFESLLRKFVDTLLNG